MNALPLLKYSGPKGETSLVKWEAKHSRLCDGLDWCSERSRNLQLNRTGHGVPGSSSTIPRVIVQTGKNDGEWMTDGMRQNQRRWQAVAANSSGVYEFYSDSQCRAYLV